MRGRTGFAAIASCLAILLVVVAMVASASAANPVLHVQDFSGYHTYKQGATTASTTFAVPQVTCGGSSTGIQPGIEATVAPTANGQALLYAATLRMVCVGGSLSVREAMFASGLETDYTNPVAAGDSITVSFASSSTGAVATLKDTTAGFTVTDSGTEPYATGQYLGIAAAQVGGNFVPTPTFTPVNFTSTLVGGKSLGDASPQDALEYGSPSACLVYTIPTGIVNAQNFAVETPPVNITGFTPTIEPVGKIVTITGSGFTSQSTVTFMGSANASSVTLVSPTELQATVPDAAVPGPITVATPKNPAGTMTELCSFDPQPVISKLSATSGPTGTSIVISGGGFSNVQSLLIGASPFTVYTVTGPTQINATIPNGSLTGKITVNTPWGDYTLASPPFTVTLSITGFSPTSGHVGTSVDIQGVGFNSSSKAKFGGKAATKTTFVSSNELKATVPLTFKPPGAITVTNSQAPTGTATSAGSFN